MSFILDALKKAESERTRHSGPVLMDVRVVQSRQRLPAWAWVLGCVLLANLVVVGWLLLLRKPAAAPVSPATPATIATQPVAPPPATPPPAAIPPPAPIAESAPPAIPAAVITPLPAPALIQAPVATRAPASTSGSPRIDLLPTWQDLVAQGVSLPALQLNLHVYDEVPANRYVLMNGRRLREGDEVADGVRVESIVPKGVVLNARGRRFVLLAGAG